MTKFKTAHDEVNSPSGFQTKFIYVTVLDSIIRAINQL